MRRLLYATDAPDNSQTTATAAPQQNSSGNTQSTTTTAPANTTTVTTAGNDTQAGTSNTLKGVSIICKANAKKITGKLSAAKATIKIKVGNKAYKKATVKGKKFTLKFSYRLKKKTKILVKVTKSGYSAFKKTYVVK